MLRAMFLQRIYKGIKRADKPKMSAKAFGTKTSGDKSSVYRNDYRGDENSKLRRDKADRAEDFEQDEQIYDLQDPKTKQSLNNKGKKESGYNKGRNVSNSDSGYNKGRNEGNNDIGYDKGRNASNNDSGYNKNASNNESGYNKGRNASNSDSGYDRDRNVSKNDSGYIEGRDIDKKEGNNDFGYNKGRNASNKDSGYNKGRNEGNNDIGYDKGRNASNIDSGYERDRGRNDSIEGRNTFDTKQHDKDVKNMRKPSREEIKSGMGKSTAGDKEKEIKPDLEGKSRQDLQGGFERVDEIRYGMPQDTNKVDKVFDSDKRI